MRPNHLPLQAILRYAKVIEWISAYSSQLRHFLRTRQLVDEIEPANAHDERDEFSTLGDEWSQHDVPDQDDSDDDDSNGEHED